MIRPTRKRLRRRDVPGTARFLKFSCYRRLRLFDNDRIKDRFVEQLVTAAERHEVSILAWVVMPEHIHLIVCDEQSCPLGPIVQTLKDPFARAVLARWRELAAPVLTQLRSTAGSTRFWQAGGGYDRNVFGPELIEKIYYVHGNPIRQGLEADSVSWRWSSAAAYQNLPGAIGPPIAFEWIPDHRGELI